eukprot:gene965-16329_t
MLRASAPLRRALSHRLTHPRFGLRDTVVDDATRRAAGARFRAAGVVLPTFAQLADPTAIPAAIQSRLAS